MSSSSNRAEAVPQPTEKVDCGSHSDPITNIWCKLSRFCVTKKLLHHRFAECLVAKLQAHCVH